MKIDIAFVCCFLTLGVSSEMVVSSVSTFAGPVSKTGSRYGEFSSPCALAFDSGWNLLYVVDQGNNRIRSIDIGTTYNGVSTVAGNGSVGFANGPGASATFNNPSDIVLLTSYSEMYIADTNNHLIRKITRTYSSYKYEYTVSTFAGSVSGGYRDGNVSVALFLNPRGLAFDSSYALYVADTGNNRIRKIALDGTVSTIAGNGVAGKIDGTGIYASFDVPVALAYYSSYYNGDFLYVTDAGSLSIRKVNLYSKYVSTFAGNDSTFGMPQGIAYNSYNGLLVADSAANSIKKVGNDNTTTLAGAGSPGSYNGDSNSSFNQPTGILATDDGYTIYVADKGNNEIRKISIYYVYDGNYSNYNNSAFVLFYLLFIAAIICIGILAVANLAAVIFFSLKTWALSIISRPGFFNDPRFPRLQLFATSRNVLGKPNFKELLADVFLRSKIVLAMISLNCIVGITLIFSPGTTLFGLVFFILVTVVATCIWGCMSRDMKDVSMLAKDVRAKGLDKFVAFKPNSVPMEGYIANSNFVPAAYHQYPPAYLAPFPAAPYPAAPYPAAPFDTPYPLTEDAPPPLYFPPSAAPLATLDQPITQENQKEDRSEAAVVNGTDDPSRGGPSSGPSGSM